MQSSAMEAGPSPGILDTLWFIVGWTSIRRIIPLGIRKRKEKRSGRNIHTGSLWWWRRLLRPGCLIWTRGSTWCPLTSLVMLFLPWPSHSNALPVLPACMRLWDWGRRLKKVGFFRKLGYSKMVTWSFPITNPLSNSHHSASFDAGTAKYKTLKEITCLFPKAFNIISVTMMSLYSKMKTRLVSCENHFLEILKWCLCLPKLRFFG